MSVPTVPIADPRRAAVALRDELEAAFRRVVESGRYIFGSEHDAFEAELSAYLGVRHCVNVASGTDALQFALVAVGCRAGDAIVTAANCGGYVTTAARSADLRVRPADVDAATLGVTRESVEAALADDVRAVVVTHLYGLMADVEEIVALCRERGIAVVEDCAQAVGARRDGRAAGSFGDAAAFSFYPTKNLAALGDGGAVVTGSDEVAERVRLLRQYGWESKYRVALEGARNSRLDELQAAFLRVRLSRLDDWNARRRSIVARYAEALDADNGRFVADSGEQFVAHLAVAIFEERERVRQQLEAGGIGTDIHYPIADHQQPAWRSQFGDVKLPVTEHAVEHVLTVPCFPELTDSEVDRVCEALGGL
jgi:dTDP-4-amino-4,6-dideoxygalactose transaminase